MRVKLIYRHRMVVGLCCLLLALTACAIDSEPVDVIQDLASVTPPAAAPVEKPPTATHTLPEPATATIIPTQTEAPSPTPTAAPVLRQITSGGCCVQPFFASDNTSILYLDRPGPDAPAGLWQVGFDGGEPRFYSDRLGLYSVDMSYRAFLQGELTVIERMADGQRWTLSNGRRAVSFSPDNALLAWTAGQSGPPYDSAVRHVWISAIDGRQERILATLYGGGFVDWLPDGRVLVDGRMQPNEEGEAYWLVSPDGGEVREVARGSRLRGARLSPDGAWLAYLVTFGPDPAENGIWLAHLESGRKIKLELFGAYRWRDGGHLVVAPLDLSSPYHSLWEVDMITNTARILVDGQATRMRIANGDWTLSPDGTMAAFVSAEDYNIWMVQLP